MKRTLWLCAGLLLAGCGQPAAPPPPAPAKPPPAVSTLNAVSNTLDVLTQRDALQAGRKAGATLRQVAESEKEDREAADIP